MSKNNDLDAQKADLWIPIAFLFLPLLLILIPIIREVNQRDAIYYMPATIRFFLVAIIFYSILSGALRHGQRHINFYLIIPAITVFSIAIYSTFFRAINTAYSFDKLLELVLVIAATYFLAKLFVRSGPKLGQYTLFAIFGSILLAVPVMATLFHFRFPDYFLWPKFMPGFVFVRIYGFSLTVAIALGTGLLSLPDFQSRAKSIMLLLGIIVLSATLFWTSSRGGIFSLILVLPTVAIFVPAARKAICLGALAIAIGAAISTLIPVQSEAFGFFNAFDDTFKATSVNRISAGRVGEWRLILGFISDYPFLGHGYGQTSLIVGGVMTPHAHTHNIVLESALAWGWIGAFSTGYLVLLLLFKAFVKTRNCETLTTIPAFITIGVLSVYAWVDGVYFYSQTLLPLAVCIAVIWATPVKTKL